ncbi:hypothetical protein ACIO1C_14620 [Streptomyces sp. NPDC087420]|uniref:hypothetical protein n=1 Tax=Streptomyces sp. NPDC087420 TaxID=3365785 RepID=UPI003839366E
MTNVPDGRPAAAEPEIAGREGLYARIPVAGRDSRLELQSEIEFGRATVIAPDAYTLDQFAAQVDRDHWDYSYVWFPFDLRPLEHGHYESVRITTTFAEPGIVAKYLAPSPGSKDVEFEGRATVWGLGMPAMSWELEPPEGNERLRPQGHHVVCLLQRPKAVEQTDVVIEVAATVVRTVVVRQVRKAATKKPCRYRLSFTEGTFVRLPG